MIIFNSYAKLPEGTSGQVGPSNGLEVGAVLQRLENTPFFRNDTYGVWTCANNKSGMKQSASKVLGNPVDAWSRGLLTVEPRNIHQPSFINFILIWGFPEIGVPPNHLC